MFISVQQNTQKNVVKMRARKIKHAPKCLAQAGGAEDSLNISLQNKDAEVKATKGFAFTRHWSEVMLLRQLPN